MKTSLRCTLVFAVLVVCFVLRLGRADEPQAATKKAVAEKPAPAEPQAVKKGEAKEPKAPAAAIEILDDLVAPIVEALAEKLDLKANDPVDAQVQQWIPQFTQQFRPMLTTELNFIRQICDLAPEQRPQIKAAGEASVKVAARKMAELQGRQIVLQRGQGVDRNTPPDPRKIIREALAKALEKSLTPEQMAKYTEEATQRTVLRKRAAILSVAARLDTTLSLTTEQRDKIVVAISEGWQDKWEQWLLISAYGDLYFPQVPDQHVVSHLNADQKSVWAGLQKVDFGFWSGGGNGEADDGWWGAEPPKAP